MTTPVIRGVNHIGITVPDIEAAKSFLVEAFGGQVIYQSFGPQDPPRQGPEFERAVGAYPGTVVRAQAMVKIGTGPDIELFEMHGPEQAQPVRASDFGITHFALYADDIDASVALREGGREAAHGAADNLLCDRKRPGNKVCYCQLPWGTTMEFIATPDRMPYHDQTDWRRWQDKD
jgi:catechol 2,3-dioxygenase-like lactoylglutathione lyase family enzyme